MDKIRRLPHQGARHGTVDHGDAYDGVFLLLHLWVLPSSWAILLPNDLPPLLSSLWMASRVNGSLSCEWRPLQQLRVEWSSVARKRRPNRPPEWARPAGLGRSAQAHPGPVRSPFAPVGPHVFMHFAPSTCTILTMSSSRPRWRFSLLKSGLLRFNPRGCSFLTLRGHSICNSIGKGRAKGSARGLPPLHCPFPLGSLLNITSNLFNQA
jgi:hypothetical protein